jgi:hypothetical protein
VEVPNALRAKQVYVVREVQNVDRTLKVHDPSLLERDVKLVLLWRREGRRLVQGKVPI